MVRVYREVGASFVRTTNKLGKGDLLQFGQFPDINKLAANIGCFYIISFSIYFIVLLLGLQIPSFSITAKSKK